MSERKERFLLPAFPILASVFLSAAPYSAMAQSAEIGGPMEAPRTDDASAEKMHQSLAETGYYEDMEGPSEVEYVSALVQTREARAATVGKSEDPAELGFYELDSETTSFPRMPFATRLVDSRYLESASKSYLLPAESTARQFHTNSKFGNLIIDEERGITSHLGIPNVQVAGYEATFARAKHPGEKWSTTLYLPVGDRFYTFQVDRELKGKQKKRFLEMAEEYILQQ